MSKIKLYRNCKILEEKNFQVDNLENYLATLSPVKVIDDAKYIKQGLDIEVNVALDQTYLDKQWTNMYNYCSIELDNGGEDNTYYYFIRDKKWISKDAIKLVLHQDVINTYKSEVDYKLSDKTHIMRQHKDRVVKEFIGDESGTINSFISTWISAGGDLWLGTASVYDVLARGKDVRTTIEFEDSSIVPTYTFNKLNGSWQVSATVRRSTNPGVINFTLNWGTGVEVYRRKIDIQPEGFAPTLYGKELGKLEDNRKFLNQNFYLIYHKGSSSELVPGEPRVFLCGDKEDIKVVYYDYMSSSAGRKLNVNTIKQISDIDRTNDQIYKIVKLPYFPIRYGIKKIKETSTGVYVEADDGEERLDLTWFDDTYGEDSVTIGPIKKRPGVPGVDNSVYMIYLRNYVYYNLLTEDFEFNVDNPLKPALETINYNNSDKGALRNDYYESKLYNSEFYQPKFIYDSFSFNFDLEKLTTRDGNPDEVDLTYSVSRNFNGTIMFKFKDYKTNGFDTDDYNDILICQRNNDLPIYNDAYLEYLRNGYNFDVKNKNLALSKGIWTTAMGVVGGAIAGAAKGSAGGVPGAIGGAIIGGILGGAAGGSSTIFGQISAENSIEQKKASAKAQGVSVSTCDDIDMLQIYGYNKAKLKLYTPSDKLKGMLADFFYYNGYADNVQEKPKIDTRYWFNFIQCEPSYVEDSRTTKMSKDCRNELTLKYTDGITILHGHQNADLDWNWDFEQVKENWETSLLN